MAYKPPRNYPSALEITVVTVVVMGLYSVGFTLYAAPHFASPLEVAFWQILFAIPVGLGSHWLYDRAIYGPGRRPLR